MTRSLTITSTISFSDEEVANISIKTSSEGSEDMTGAEAAMALFFKSAMTTQTEVMANLAVEYGNMAQNALDAIESQE